MTFTRSVKSVLVNTVERLRFPREESSLLEEMRRPSTTRARDLFPLWSMHPSFDRVS